MLGRRYSNNFIRSILSLMKKQPWLAEQEEEIMALVDECETKDEQELIFDLLHRFVYLEHDEFTLALENLFDVISNKWGLEENTTQLMATSIGHIPDSGQFLLYGLKPILQRKGWYNPKILNSAARPTRFIESHPNIVLIDEFIGTGETVIGRIHNLKRIATDKSIDLNRIGIYVCAIACSTVGKMRIENQGYPLHCQFLLKKEISDYYVESEMPERKKNMLRLESILSKEYQGTPLPSFGHGQCESLYARKDTNAPNSVFPIFWWPFKGDTFEKRMTILSRLMGNV